MGTIANKETQIPTPAARQSAAIESLRQVVERHADKIFEGLPAHLNRKRILTSAMLAVRQNPELAECTPISFAEAIRGAAFYGWEVGGPLAHAYLVPFKNNKKHCREVQLIPGYRGLIELARRAGVGQIEMNVVYEGDQFSCTLGDSPTINHVPSPDQNRQGRKPTHVYVIAYLPSGLKQRSVWTAAQIEAHKRQFSASWDRDDSPWKTHWATMAKKTVLRDMIARGLLPVSAEERRMVQHETLVHDASAWTTEIQDDTELRDQLLESSPPRQLEQEQSTDSTSTIVEFGKRQMDEATTLTALDEIINSLPGDVQREEVFELEEYANVRREEIRAARGERSNNG